MKTLVTVLLPLFSVGVSPLVATAYPFPPFNIEPVTTGAHGNAARRNSGGYFDDPDAGYFNTTTSEWELWSAQSVSAKVLMPTCEPLDSVGLVEPSDHNRFTPVTTDVAGPLGLQNPGAI